MARIDHTQTLQLHADHTPTLKTLMQLANIPSYRALATQASVSRWQVQQLRAGKIAHMRLDVLAQLAKALQVSLSTLLNKFGWVEAESPQSGQATSALPTSPSPQASAAQGQLVALRQEYQRLQAQVARQAEMVRSQLQIEALQTLETWLIQWPTIAQRARANETLSAAKILPFVRPVEQLMGEWDVVAIAPVDAQIPYDPQLHQLMGGTAQPGTTVQVTHSGCQHQGKLLHRAKVKLV